MQLNSILTVLDKPKHRQTALQASARLQKLSGAELDLVAFRWDALLEHGALFDARQRRKIRRATHARCTAWQRSLMASAGLLSAPTSLDQSQDSHSQSDKQLAVTGQTHARMIWTHDIAHWLTEESQQSRHDLIVKSAVQKRQSLLLTPLDWQLIRGTRTPLLLTSHRRKSSASGRILVALDFKQDDARHRHLNSKLLAAAQCFAALNNAELHCVFVVEISEILRDLDIVDARVSKQAVLKNCMPQIERTLAAYRIPKSRVYFPVGKPSQLIAAQAHKQNADLLVIGTWAHKIRQAFGLGNTAEKILGKAPCDVLTVHP